MATPIIFISHFHLRAGAFDAFQELLRAVAAQLRVQKPRTLTFFGFTDEARTRVTMVHVFGDAEAMRLHVEGADMRSEAASAFLDPMGWEVYGSPDDSVVSMLREAADGAGAPLAMLEHAIAGFHRNRA